MKQKIILFFLMLVSLSTYAQQRNELRGNIVNSATNEPVSGVNVTLRGQNQSTMTDAKGEFHFMSVAKGEDIIALTSASVQATEFPVQIEADAVNLLKDIKVIVMEGVENLALMSILDEANVDDDGSTQNISSMIIMSNDLYLNKASYGLSAFRFRVRGYDNTYQDKYINGVKFNDQNRGMFNYASIGALNDLTRNGDAVNYQSPNTFTYGTIGGTENLNMRAGNYSKGGKVTLSYTNRAYYGRAMANYSTGLRDDGYAFTVAIGGRYSDEGNVKGTSYRNMSYALAFEKQWNGGEHSLSFTTFGSPVERGQQGSSYQETYDLVRDRLYNPNWGFQNGKKRNSRMVRAIDPTAILSHVWKINRTATLTTGYGMHYQYDGRSALNWYNGADPRPDYYRYMPNYYYAMAENNPGAIAVAKNYEDRWRSKDSKFTQVNWDKMIEINKFGQRRDSEDPDAAIYMVEERRSDLFEHSLNSTLNMNLSNNMKMTAGIGLRTTESKQFKTVKDLLGSKYVLDIDKFSERDEGQREGITENSKQNDLNNPNAQARKGNKFGYDFRLNIHSANAWIQNQYTSNKVDMYYGMKLEWTSFRRHGYMMNGRSPLDSYGQGKSHTFMDFGAKAGITYKFTGRHFVTANISFVTEAPLPNDAYVAPRISDRTVDLKSAKIFSADISYIFSLPSFNGRVSVFQTNFFDKMKKTGYYHDSERTFMNHVLTGMNITHRGIELGANYKIDNNWNIDLAGTVAEYYYSNNPDGVLSAENGSTLTSSGKKENEETVYLKDYYVGGTPQIAGTLGVNYFNNFWFLNLSVNGVARNYIDPSPSKRVSSIYEGKINPNLPADAAAFKQLTKQERIGSSYTLDFSIGKIFYIGRGKSVNFNLAFNNLLNRKNIRTGGYEQSRIDTSYPDKFQSKYFYMQGFNCFLNGSFKF